MVTLPHAGSRVTPNASSATMGPVALDTFNSGGAESLTPVCFPLSPQIWGWEQGAVSPGAGGHISRKGESGQGWCDSWTQGRGWQWSPGCRAGSLRAGPGGAEPQSRAGNWEPTCRAGSWDPGRRVAGTPRSPSSRAYAWDSLIHGDNVT